MIVTEDGESRNRFGKKQSLVLVGLIFLIAAYFAYQYYQTRQYISHIMPLYKSMDMLYKDQEKAFIDNDGRLYKDIIADCERIKKDSTSLKLRFVEITPNTTEAVEISDAMVDALDKLIGYSEAAEASVRADLSVVVEAEMVSKLHDQYMSSSYYISDYLYQSLLERRSEYEKDVQRAKKNKSKAYTARANFQEDARLKVDQLLGRETTLPAR